MDELIHTRYHKAGYSSADDILLDETSRTRMVFKPGVHRGGVRGHIVRQKIGPNGQWKDANEVNFNVVPADCGVKIELDTNATRKLHDALTHLYTLHAQGVPTADQRYVLAREEQVVLIDDGTKQRAIQQLLEKGYTEDFWSALVQDKPDLASRLAAAKIQLDREQAIAEFGVSLARHATDEEFWQEFFGHYPWMLQSAFSAPVFMLRGETYVGGKIAEGRQGVGGVATDFLFADESTKGFAVVEIKTPHASLVGSQYRGRHDAGHSNEVYTAHGDLSGGIVQVRNQISVAVEDFRSVIGRSFDELNCVHPKGVLVIGTTYGMSERQKDSFNQLRQALHSLTVITFDELHHRLRLLFTEGNRQITHANQRISTPSSNPSPWEEPPF